MLFRYLFPIYSYFYSFCHTKEVRSKHKIVGSNWVFYKNYHSVAVTILIIQSWSYQNSSSDSDSI